MAISWRRIRTSRIGCFDDYFSGVGEMVDDLGSVFIFWSSESCEHVDEGMVEE